MSYTRLSIVLVCHIMCHTATLSHRTLRKQKSRPIGNNFNGTDNNGGELKLQ